MITVNLIYRVFRIANGSASGTAFTIDVDARQYLITAKQLFRIQSVVFVGAGFEL